MDCTVPGILKARVLEWAAIPFSRGSSLPRDQTPVSCIAGRFFTNWAIREAPVAFNERQLVFRKTQLLRPVQVLLGDLIWVGLSIYVKKLGSLVPSPQVFLCIWIEEWKCMELVPVELVRMYQLRKQTNFQVWLKCFQIGLARQCHIYQQLSNCPLTYKRQYRHSWCSAIFWSISWHISS